MNRKSFWIVLIGVHALFLIKQCFIYNSLIQDGVEYIFAADNLINKGTLYAWNLNFAFNPDWLTKRPLLYPAILAFFKWLSFGNSWLFFFITYLVQNLISLNTIRLCLKIAYKYQMSYKHWHVLLFLLFSVSQFIYANFIMSEIWLQSCLLGIVYLLLMQPFNNKTLLKISALLIIGLSIKPVLLFACMLLPIVYLIFQRKQLQLLGFIICLLPLTFYYSISYINQQRTGHFQYSSITTINLIHYNTYVTLMNVYGTHKADSMIDHIKINTRKMSYSDQQNYIESESKKLLKQHIGTYSYLHGRGIVFALIDPGRFDFTQFFHLPHKSNLIYQTNQKGMFNTIIKSFLNPLGALLILLMCFNVFRLYIGLKFVVNKQLSWYVKMTILAFPLYILTFTGPIGTSRFFMPLIPFALLMFLFTSKKSA